MASRSFPHPVLDPSATDYPNCGIQFRADMYSSPSAYRFEVSADLGSETLQAEIESGNAIFAVQVDCRWTCFREVYRFTSPGVSIEIPEGRLRGSVWLRPYIVAQREFTLASEEFDKLFKGMSFPIERGYVLGWDNPIEFDAIKSLDDLKNISSVLQIVRSRKEGVPIEYSLNGEKIEIHLPKADYEAFSLYKNHPAFRDSLMCMLAMPAIACATEAHLRDDNLQTRWSRVIERRINEYRAAGNNEEDPWKLAQIMLDLPISRAMQSIMAHVKEGDS
jgi:hypothetical protein